MKFPRILDCLGRPLASLTPEGRSCSLDALQRMFRDANRLDEKSWLTAYLYAVGRGWTIAHGPPHAADVVAAGLLLARALAEGWVEEAPGPRSGRGWCVTTSLPVPVRGEAPWHASTSAI